MSQQQILADQIGSGTIATARLGSGTANNTTFLRGDQAYAVPAGGGGSPGTFDITVANSTLSTIPEGSVVAWNFSASGGVPEVQLASAATTPGQGPALGILTGALIVGGTATCRCIGIYTGLDTSGFAVGDDVFEGDAGAIVNYGTATGKAWLGTVLVSDVSVGSIFIGSGLGSLAYTPTHGHYNASSGNPLSRPVFTEIAAPSSPAAASQAIYIDSTTHHITRKNSSGTIKDLENSSAYTTGTDQTGSRALNTNYTNGSYRRRVHASVDCVATITNAATIGAKTTVGGTALNLNDQAGAPSGIVQSDRAQLNFEVDPGATYGVNSAIGGSSTATLVRWIEVDE